MMEERRRYNDKLISDMHTDIAVIKNMLEANHKALRADIKRNAENIAKHDKTLYGNGDKGLTSIRDGFGSLVKSFKDHTIQDRWIMGTQAASQVAIIVMLVKLVLNG